MQDQPSSQPEQPSYQYPQPGPGMPPPQQYQQPPMQPGMYPPQQPPKKKRGPLFWIGGGCLALVLLAVIGGIIIVVSASHAVSTAVNGSSTSGTGNSSSGNQISKVGGTITLSGVQATLVSVKTNPGSDMDTPKAGNEYVIVHVRMHNTTDNEVDYNVLDFHAKSGTGNITDEELVSFVNNSNQLNSGKLAAGGSVEGDIVFQVPKGDHKAELTWQPSFFGNAGDNGWMLGL